MGTTHGPQATAHQVAAATSVDALAAAFHCLESFEKRAKVREPSHTSLSSVVGETDDSIQAKIENENLMRKHGRNVDDENHDSNINSRKKTCCVEAVRGPRMCCFKSKISLLVPNFLHRPSVVRLPPARNSEPQHPYPTHPRTMAAEGSTAAAATAGEGGKALHELYPANAYMELTLSAESGGEKVSGIVHCTDEISNTVVLRSSLVYTTLSSQIRFVGAATIAESKVIRKAGEEGGEAAAEGEAGPTAADIEEMSRPLPPPPTKKALEEREKRALKTAMEHMKHINDSATPLGQATFDKLLKACNSVEWVDGTAIVVLGEVRVDEPYGPEDCVLIRPGKTERERNLAMDSLNRVKKIIAHKG